MLEHTFCHIPGIGAQTERALWSAGVLNWEAALSDRTSLPLSPGRAAQLRTGLEQSVEHLDNGDADYFYQQLRADQHWRLFSRFGSGAAYLDIETTGLGSPEDYITTLVLYDGRTVFHYVHGDDLEKLGAALEACSLLVTYNGKSFDAPFIRRCLDFPLQQPHIDLRYVLGSLGFRGGLKGCEQQLGIDRGGLEEVDGFFAVLLWHEFRRSGDQRVLDTLLAYNALDTINLEQLMVLAYNMQLEKTPFFAAEKLPLPLVPANPFRADSKTIERLKGSAWSAW